MVETRIVTRSVHSAIPNSLWSGFEFDHNRKLSTSVSYDTRGCTLLKGSHCVVDGDGH